MYDQIWAVSAICTEEALTQIIISTKKFMFIPLIL